MHSKSKFPLWMFLSIFVFLGAVAFGWLVTQNNPENAGVVKTPAPTTTDFQQDVPSVIPTSDPVAKLATPTSIATLSVTAAPLPTVMLTPSLTPTPVKTTGINSRVTAITMDAVKTEGGVVNVSWTTTGSSSLGYAVVWSSSPNPVFPSQTSHYLSDPAANADQLLDLQSGNTYYIRVCEYLSPSSCGIYSNETAVSY